MTDFQRKLKNVTETLKQLYNETFSSTKDKKNSNSNNASIYLPKKEDCNKIEKKGEIFELSGIVRNKQKQEEKFAFKLNTVNPAKRKIKDEIGKLNNESKINLDFSMLSTVKQKDNKKKSLNNSFNFSNKPSTNTSISTPMKVIHSKSKELVLNQNSDIDKFFIDFQRNRKKASEEISHIGNNSFHHHTQHHPLQPTIKRPASVEKNRRNKLISHIETFSTSLSTTIHHENLRKCNRPIVTLDKDVLSSDYDQKYLRIGFSSIDKQPQKHKLLINNNNKIDFDDMKKNKGLSGIFNRKRTENQDDSFANFSRENKKSFFKMN